MSTISAHLPSRLIRVVAIFGIVCATIALLVSTLLMETHTVHAYTTLAAASAAGPQGNDVSIDIDNIGFVPSVVTIAVGTEVVWENTSDIVSHRVVFSGGLNSPLLQVGEKYTRVFTMAGDYPYACGQHPSELGVVHVDGGLPPNPDPGNSGQAELHIATTHNQTIAPGAAVDYRVRFENSSDSVAAQNVVVTVTLPASSSLVSSSPAPLSQVGHTLVYSIGTLPADTEGRIDLRIQMAANLPTTGDVTVQALIAATNMSGSSGGYSEDSKTLTPPKLSLGIRPDHNSEFLPNASVTYTLEYVNHSDETAAEHVTITLQLPPDVSFVAAQPDHDGAPVTLTQMIVGKVISLYIGTLAPDASGRLLLQLHLSGNITASQDITLLGQIAAANFIGSGTGNNNGSSGDHSDVITSTESVPSSAPDLYVRLASSGDNNISGTRTFLIAFGNAGLLSAHNVKLSATFASVLGALDFGSNPPTNLVGNTATWDFIALPGRLAAQPFVVQATIVGTGELTATAHIAGDASNAENDPSDNAASENIPAYPLTAPSIYSPKRAIVGTQPIIRGIGMANAAVSVYLSGTTTTPGRLLGTALVGPDRLWVVTPTQPISVTGWHWITATQVLTTQASIAGGARFYVSDTLHIDVDSITRNNIPLGGLNAKALWQANQPYQLAMRITACSVPVSPTLQALMFNAQGLLTGYDNYTGTLTNNDVTTFTFGPLAANRLFELYVDYYCPVALQRASQNSPSALQAAWVHYHDCFDAPGCVDSPPDPPEDCEDCYVESEDRPITLPRIDPDGFVYDAGSVRAGATITQAIITNASITVTRQISPNIFMAWNAFAFNQVNPQFSDSLYPDKVLIPGYYAFFVTPGVYKVHVTAPGFLGYESNALVVQAKPVTLNVPMERTNGALQAVGATAATRLFVYLPVSMR